MLWVLQRHSRPHQHYLTFHWPHRPAHQVISTVLPLRKVSSTACLDVCDPCSRSLGKLLLPNWSIKVSFHFSKFRRHIVIPAVAATVATVSIRVDMFAFHWKTLWCLINAQIYHQSTAFLNLLWAQNSRCEEGWRNEWYWREGKGQRWKGERQNRERRMH